MSVEMEYGRLRARAEMVGHSLADMPLHEARLVVDMVAKAMDYAAEQTGSRPSRSTPND